MTWCAISVIDTNGAPDPRCATSKKNFNFFSIFFKTSNGAPVDSAPLLVKLVMAHHIHGAPLVENFQIFFNFFFKTSNGAPWEWCAITSSPTVRHY